ncbi:helix-turn-helix domain-containing protein [Chitiniphilus purpureus]|uniref:Helix-turn-helix domain-containing protein n=1 Tax=Chitiniphilus purpureus TaxID=2981137 RepID=A0ABY6DSK9_9NEIS|nr:helix-turn-helix transcriptional regulator [Chitiniphilus sp. CD1]UXY16703.1 helix-turn-helix domain-containing protein [Chitiniphilus sp. CD1]
MTFGHRLRAERERVGLNQKEFGAIGGVSKTTQLNYEADERHPDTKYLDAIAAHGVDLVFLLTGRRDPYANNPEHQLLLGAYGTASPELRQAALRVLLSGQAVPAAGSVTQTASGAHATNVSGSHNTVNSPSPTTHVAGDIGQQVAGNVTVKGGFNMGGKKK